MQSKKVKTTNATAKKEKSKSATAAAGGKPKVRATTSRENRVVAAGLTKPAVRGARVFSYVDHPSARAVMAAHNPILKSFEDERKAQRKLGKTVPIALRPDIGPTDVYDTPGDEYDLDDDRYQQWGRVWTISDDGHWRSYGSTEEADAANPRTRKAHGQEEAEEHATKTAGSDSYFGEIADYLKEGKMVLTEMTRHLLMTKYGFLAQNVSHAVVLINQYLEEGLTLPLAFQAAHLFFGGFTTAGDAEAMAKKIMQYGSSAIPASYVDATAGSCHNGIREWRPVQTGVGPGIAVVFHQEFVALTTTNLSTKPLTHISGAADVVGTSPGYAVQLSPDKWNGRIAGLAQWYARWYPQQVELDYTPEVGTGTEGIFAAGISRDPGYLDVATVGATPTYVGVLQLGSDGQCAQLSPYQRASLVSRWGATMDDGADFLYTEADSAGTTHDSERLTSAGMFVCIAGQAGTADQPRGRFEITGEIVLAAPSSDYGLTTFMIARKLMGSYAYRELIRIIAHKDSLFELLKRAGIPGGYRSDDPEVDKVLLALRALGVAPPAPQPSQYSRWLDHERGELLTSKRNLEEHAEGKPSPLTQPPAGFHWVRK
jgi:hypothetical protein